MIFVRQLDSFGDGKPPKVDDMVGGGREVVLGQQRRDDVGRWGWIEEMLVWGRLGVVGKRRKGHAADGDCLSVHVGYKVGWDWDSSGAAGVGL